MSISSHAKQQAGGSPPRRAGPIRYAALGNGGDDAERRPTKAPCSSCTMTAAPSCNENCYSWETRAFAEESKSQLDWPPRAYPCTFCEREFRSAQALGGHMNVHRRDRARLRHASPPRPPSPAFGSIAASPHSRSLLQAHNFSTVLSSAQCSNEWLESLHSPAIPLFNSSNIPYTSPNLAHPSAETASLPLRLQQLASEAAASLSEYPHLHHRCKASGLFSRMSPLIANCGSYGCHSSKGGTVVNEKSPEIVSTSSSFPSPPSSNASSSTPLPLIRDGAKRRWDNPMIEPDEERPWKANDRNQLLSHIITDSDALKESHNSLDIRPFKIATASDIVSMLRIKQAFESASGIRSEGDVDLELRLGRKPPSEEVRGPSSKLA